MKILPSTGECLKSVTVYLSVKTGKRSYFTWSRLYNSTISSPYMLANGNLTWALLTVEKVSSEMMMIKNISNRVLWPWRKKKQNSDSKVFNPHVWGWLGSLSLVLFGNFTTDRLESPNQVAFLTNKYGNGCFDDWVLFPICVSLLHLHSIIKELYFYQSENTCKHLSVLMISYLHLKALNQSYRRRKFDKHHLEICIMFSD